jgi:hypothetical protein
MAVLEDVDFSEAYTLPIPEQDGYRADAIRVRFTGVVDLDRTSLDDLAFTQALKLAEPVRLVVTGAPDAKTFRHNLVRGDEGRVEYSVTIRIDQLEIGEAA